MQQFDLETHPVLILARLQEYSNVGEWRPQKVYVLCVSNLLAKQKLMDGKSNTSYGESTS